MRSVFYPSDIVMVKKFEESLQQHLEPIYSMRQSLGIVHMPFEEEGHIRPIQCRRYIQYLKDACQKTQVASSFLINDRSVPLVFYALRHQLLPNLYLIKEHANILIRHLEQYQFYPSQTNKIFLHHEICDCYQMLLSSFIEFEQQLQPLLDEALFQHRRMQTSLRPFSDVISISM